MPVARRMSAPHRLAFEAIERLSLSETAEGVREALSRSVSALGVENFCISGLPGPDEDATPYVVMSGWPQDWLERYLRLGYIHGDPIIAKVRTSDRPFAWNEAPYDPADPRQARVMNEAPEFGLRDGFAVPIHTARGFQAIVTFGARRLELSRAQRSALHLIAIYAHARGRDLARVEAGRPAVRGPRLSARETECLQWSAEGKTTWEISVILGLSQKTVAEYIASAALKLDASNRTHAVAEAFRRGLIR